MRIVIALGNPGDKYKFTKHNVGFMIADYLADKFGSGFVNEPKFKAHISKIQIANEAIILVKPQTFMNLSGEALSLVLNYYKSDIKDILVVFDDLSLDLGCLRFRASGSDGGHNGIKSLIKHLGGNNKFDRLKVGIGPQPFIKGGLSNELKPNQLRSLVPSESFVLSNFLEDEKPLLKKVIEKSAEAIECYLKNGVEAVQNSFNGAIE